MSTKIDYTNRKQKLFTKNIYTNCAIGQFNRTISRDFRHPLGYPTTPRIFLKQRGPPLPLRSGNHTYNIKYGPAPKPLGYQNKGDLISKGFNFQFGPILRKFAISMVFDISSLISRHLFEKKKIRQT